MRSNSCFIQPMGARQRKHWVLTTLRPCSEMVPTTFRPPLRASAQASHPVTSCKLEMKPEERLESPKRFSMVVRLLLKLAL